MRPQAGDVVLHSPDIVHASTDPQIPLMRLSTDIRFQRAGTRADAEGDMLMARDFAVFRTRDQWVRAAHDHTGIDPDTGGPHTASTDGGVTATYQSALSDPTGVYNVTATGNRGTVVRATFVITPATTNTT